MKPFCQTLLAIFVLFLGIFIYNIVTYTSLQCEITSYDDEHIHFPASATAMDYAKRLSQVIQIQTISYEDAASNLTTFEEFHTALRKFFPLCHRYMDVKVINKHSLLYKWEGQDKEKLPIMLYAHLDVVPVDDASEWEQPPFEGRIEGGFVWGRGAIDAKHQVMGTMEAAEALLSQQYKPQRTVYIAFGHDEEIQGYNGAQKIAEYFTSQKIKFEYVLDEGMVILKPPMFPGLEKDLAVIGVAEKGFLTLEFSVNGTGGHASMPPQHTAIGTLSAALAKLENNPQPPSLLGAGPMLDYVGREITYPMKAVLANIWLFKWPIFTIFSQKPTLNTLIRTTTAVTVIEGGLKANVLPKSARALVNHRVSPHQTIEDVIEFDRQTINDPSVHIRVVAATEPSPISSPTSYGFKTIQHTIQQIFKNTIVAPGLMVATTDSKWFWDFTPNIYRFCPNVMDNADLGRLHGRNERISIDAYKNIIEFYYHLIRNSDSPHL